MHRHIIYMVIQGITTYNTLHECPLCVMYRVTCVHVMVTCSFHYHCLNLSAD